MNNRIKDIALGSLLTLCVVGIFNFGIPAQASIDLQSVGKIVVTNPETNLEEVIFDANDQTILKERINANTEEISRIENSMGGLEFSYDVDGKGQYRVSGASEWRHF